jgi:hypothetical protein
VVLTDEMGGGLTIEEISWCSFYASPDGVYQDVEIHLGLCASDTLGQVFDDNYIPGTKTLVLSADTLVAELQPDQWFTIGLDEPYSYTGEENLLIDIYHEPGGSGLYTWSWSAGEGRSVGTFSAPWTQGSLDDLVPWMIISGSLSLERSTFAGVKVVLVSH